MASRICGNVVKPVSLLRCPPARYDVEWRFQAGCDVLRARHWNVAIILTCPATAYTPLSLANGRPVERCDEKRMIDRVIVGKTKRADEACRQKEPGNRLDSPLDQAEREGSSKAMTDEDRRGARQRGDRSIISVEPSRQRLPFRGRQARPHDFDPLRFKRRMQPRKPVCVRPTMRTVEYDNSERHQSLHHCSTPLRFRTG